MTRTEVYSTCLSSLSKSSFLLLELPTGFGKSKLSIDLVNHLVFTKFRGRPVSMLLLVAKTVHKQSWQDEFHKWGGIHVSSLTIECYESLHKHEHEHFDIVVMDEVHHIGSDLRLQSLSTVSWDYALGLSATVPQRLKQYFVSAYHAAVVSCGVVEAIESEVLPEPQIVLLPLQLDAVHPSETIEVNPKAKGKVHQGSYNDVWRFRKLKVHAVVSCTQKQKVNEFNSRILYEKQLFERTRQPYVKNMWLFLCGERLKYLAYLKNNIVYSILLKLQHSRSITFCKTIEQAELLGKYCIHSQNKYSSLIYSRFNEKKINHITSVNILNENANLVDCKFAVFANYSSSDVIGPQRLGRSLRHKSPVIIMPYYEGTREQEIITKMLAGFNESCIHTIHSLAELDRFIPKPKK